ncbi:hypothetical protein GGR50DRAFT_654048 [Xylaria sp. CBS 124048]|nr:hypothetical protein GGR50DRAFT_654048 [Xylaria sp. CBS 124048]
MAQTAGKDSTHLGAEAARQGMGANPRYSDGAISRDPDEGSSARSSGSHWASKPGFDLIDGDIEGHGYNETTVDIIAVPCIGASPVDTWARDPLTDSYFAPPPTELGKYSTVKQLPESSVLAPAITHPLPKASHLWIRQGIRQEVSQARVMLYRHRELSEDMTIERAADDLIEQVKTVRTGLDASRPLFFVCHSIGGLVVKAALVKAKKHEELRPLLFNCHGITFFATPHRGSSYLSMPILRESIQDLLFLEEPLPVSITKDLHLECKSILQLHDTFVDLTGDLRIWTFYETVDSQLSGLGNSRFNEVHFSAPITSIKSGLVGSRGENCQSIESDHAHCASFGLQNRQIMHSYLRDLGVAVRHAEQLSSKFVHTPLRLSHKVKVELTGFYEDPEDSESTQSKRLYVSQYHLSEFLQRGPEDCIRERLNTMAPRFRQAVYPRSRGPVHYPYRQQGAKENVRESGQRPPVSTDLSQIQRADVPRKSSPEIVVTETGPPAIETSPMRSRGLIVPALMTPSLTHHRMSGESAGTDQDETAALLHRDEDHAAGESTDFEEENVVGRRMGRFGTTALPEVVAGFSRPNPMKRKFMWIHLPFNNPIWVKRMFDKISEDQNRNYSKLLSNNYWTSKHVHGRRSNWHVSYVKTGCGFVPAETSNTSSSRGRRGRSTSPKTSPAHFYLYLPYLHYDTYVNIVRRRNVLKRRLAHGRARPVPEEIADLDSLESQMIWAYIGYDPPYNSRRTLDQYGYPSLQDTWARDDDQMLYKLTKERISIPPKRKTDTSPTIETPRNAVSPASLLASAVDRLKRAYDTSGAKNVELDSEESLVDGNVLMVDQLWLWAIDNTTLMTFFPRRESHPAEGPLFQQADLRNSIFNELNGDLTGQCDNALDLAAFITLHAVTVLLDRASHPDLEIFQIFEEAIGILTEKMTYSLKEFRLQSYSKVYDDSESDDPEDNGSKAIRMRHQRELERAERQNRENTSALLELRDLDDELHTLLNLFSEQQDTILNMLESSSKSEQGFTEFGQLYLNEALRRLEEYGKLVRDMMDRVESTRKDFEKLQEMIQRQAQVDDVRSSRLQTELADAQNTSVMIFTIFTVIFLPLSFFTGLFGMNTREWGGPNENDFVSLRTIGAISRECLFFSFFYFYFCLSFFVFSFSFFFCLIFTFHSLL